MKSDMERLLEGSNLIERQRKVIAALTEENALLRAKVSERTTFDSNAELPALLRKQA